MSRNIVVGILAFQGDFAKHQEAFARLGPGAARLLGRGILHLLPIGERSLVELGGGCLLGASVGGYEVGGSSDPGRAHGVDPDRQRNRTARVVPCPWEPQRTRSTKSLGASERTDGVWVWPDKMGHYILHNVMLPVEFMTHIRNNKYELSMAFIIIQIIAGKYIGKLCFENSQYFLRK